jgi:glycine cleavage system aminomethyltransferase T
VAVGGVRNPEAAGETESFIVRLGVTGEDGTFEVVGEADQGVTFTAISSNDL